jgi:hypothetical protein
VKCDFPQWNHSKVSWQSLLNLFSDRFMKPLERDPYFFKYS